MGVIEQNTVPATEQVSVNQTAGIVTEGGRKRVLFIGNSITRHGPKVEIGWNGDWGMAASAPEKDYVHQTAALLERRGYPVDYSFFNFSKWEVNYWDDTVLKDCDTLLAFKPDVVVIRLGENIWSRAVRERLKEFDLYTHFERMVKEFAREGVKVILTDLFWAQEQIDGVICRVATENGYPLVHLGDLGEQNENKAVGLFEHAGVAAHPGDLGMYRIAKRIAQAILREL